MSNWPHHRVSSFALTCLIAWGVFLCFGTSFIHRRILEKKEIDRHALLSTHRYVGRAATNLRRNHRIRALDLVQTGSAIQQRKVPSPVGRYVDTDLSEGADVFLDQLNSQPTLPKSDAERTVPLSIKSQPDLVEAVDAGSEVDILEEDKVLGKDLRVVALTCGTDTKVPCVMWVAVSNEDVPKIGKMDRNKMLIVVRAL